MERETIINYTCLPSTSFNQIWGIIVGDLKKYEWVVMRVLTIDSSTGTKINNMAIKGAGKEGAWKSTETSEKMMKWSMTSTLEFLKIRILGI